MRYDLGSPFKQEPVSEVQAVTNRLLRRRRKVMLSDTVTVAAV